MQLLPHRAFECAGSERALSVSVVLQNVLVAQSANVTGKCDLTMSVAVSVCMCLLVRAECSSCSA